MTKARIIVGLILSFLYVGSAFAQLWDPGARHWIGYGILGPINHPIQPAYFSTQHFKMRVPSLTVLSPERYAIVATFTQAQLNRPECPGKPLSVSEANVYWVQMVKHDKKRTRKCLLPKTSACSYFSGVVGLSGITWSKQELQPLATLMDELECRGIHMAGEGRHQ
jgi:hypothetical protein